MNEDIPIDKEALVFHISQQLPKGLPIVLIEVPELVLWVLLYAWVHDAVQLPT